MSLRTPADALLFTARDTTPAPLAVTVLHTSNRSTLRAVQEIVRLTHGLNPNIRLLVLQVVPYPLSIEKPDVALEFIGESLVELLLPIGLEIHVDIRVGRDRAAMLESAFTRQSMIVVGSGRRWWGGADARVIKLLRRLGHQVISTDSE